MAALAQLRKRHAVVTPPPVTKVPTGGALVAPAAPVIAAQQDAMSGPYASSALQAPVINAAGADPSVAALAGQALAAPDLSGGKGGPADGQLIRHPEQPDVMYAKDGGAGSGDLAGMVSAIAKLAGKGGTSDPGMSDGSSMGPDTAANDDSPGLLQRIKDLFLGPKTRAVPTDGTTGETVKTTPVEVRDLPPPTPAAALSPGDTAPAGPALTSVPVTPTPRPDQPGDQLRAVPAPGPALQPQVNTDISSIKKDMPRPDTSEAMDFFDRLRADKVRMAMLMGGLSTMSAASRPGATVLGSIGEGALGGIKSVYDEEASQRDEALAQHKQAADDANAESEGALRKAQGAWYDTRGTIEQAKVDAATTRANAYAKHMANPAAASPTALQKNAQFYVQSGVAKDIPTAINMLRTGVNDAATFQRLVQAEKKIIQSTPDGLTMSDADAELLAQNNVRTRAASAAQTGALAGNNKPGAKPGPVNVGALHQQAVDAIKQGKDPAAARALYKKLSGKDADF